MKVDKALANFGNSSELRRGGDTGRRRVEHRSFLQVRFTQHLKRVIRRLVPHSIAIKNGELLSIIYVQYHLPINMN